MSGGRLLRLFGWLAAGLAIAFLAIAGYAARQQLRAAGARADGTVIRLEAAGGPQPAFCPVVAFTTTAGEPIELRSGVCARPPAYDVGETVAVDYDPADPQNASYGGFFTRWFLVLIFGIFGLGIAVGSGLLLWQGRRRPS
ncbi:DUF3592 domain-containing protein [Zavarzinia sp.]|uniref:DUF3592 domain-containing protein n=1 Tax=Zavarzinia sp. TaxID=2027920 RepID=UPI00356542AE